MLLLALMGRQNLIPIFGKAPAAGSVCVTFWPFLSASPSSSINRIPPNISWALFEWLATIDHSAKSYGPSLLFYNGRWLPRSVPHTPLLPFRGSGLRITICYRLLCGILHTLSNKNSSCVLLAPFVHPLSCSGMVIPYSGS